ncbi:MAG: DEAD/DEAH box helicase [Bacteroidales bacterium]|nr:DEAD/DEAH box helicase [Bacteroidales bacterium]
MKTFHELGLEAEILNVLDEIKFVNPTPIQEQAIPFLLESNSNLIASAQTGTGKTAAFGLPIIQKIDSNINQIQALILSPTRELALQIAKDITVYSKYEKKLKTVTVYGGASIDTQIRELSRGAHIVVGTPGRVLDLIKRKRLIVGKLRFLVLDEADEMLNMGFKDELDAILAGTPDNKQNLLFSATMPPEMERIAKKYISDAHRISVAKQNIGASTVKHQYYIVQARDRYKAIKRLVDYNTDIYGIVFCRTRMETKEVADKLMADGYNADALHGDLSQAQRDYVMGRFRKKQIQLLVATDVAARGLDVDNLSHIINYNLPDDSEIYIHRSGRTGRAGKEGISISIMHLRENSKLRSIEKMVGKRFEKKEVPQGSEICERQLFHLINKMQNVDIEHERIAPFLPAIYKKLEHLSKEEIIQGFVSMEFNRFLDYYKNAQDLNVSGRPEKGKEPFQRNKGNLQRFYINLGTKDNVGVGDLLSLVSKNLRNREAKIGKVDLLKTFSFFEVDKKYTDKILSSFKGKEFNGREIFVQKAENNEPKRRNKRRSR